MLTIAESPLWTNTPYEAEVLLLKKLLNLRIFRDENDKEAMNLMKKYKTFGRKTPEFLLIDAKLAVDD